MQYDFINKLEQFGRIDCEIILLDDKNNIVLREGRQFDKGATEKEFDSEAQRTINAFLNPPPAEDPPPTQDELIAAAVLKAKTDTLNEIITIVAADKNVDPKTLAALNAKLDVAVTDATVDEVQADVIPDIKP